MRRLSDGYPKLDGEDRRAAVWRPTEDPHLSTRSLVPSVTTVQLQSVLFEESVPQ